MRAMLARCIPGSYLQEMDERNLEPSVEGLVARLAYTRQGKHQGTGQ
jgi:hypothetical protein